MVPQQQVRLNLYAPGMTRWHQVGLAALAMTVLNWRKDEVDAMPYEVEGEVGKSTVTLSWDKEFPLCKALLERAFRVDEDGLANFSTWTRFGQDGMRYVYHTVFVDTFLQHPRTRVLGQPAVRTVDLGGEQLPVKYRPIIDFVHRNVHTDLDRAFKGTPVELKGWMLPGATVRHVKWGDTALTEPFERALPLIFAPLGCLYFNVSQRDNIGRWSDKATYAVGVPQVTHLSRYAEHFSEYLATLSKEAHCTVSTIGEAALESSIAFTLGTTQDYFRTSVAEVVAFGKVPGNRQTVRSGVYVSRNVPESSLALYKLLRGVPGLRSRPVKTEEGGFFWDGGVSRGLFADNIARNVLFYRNFAACMSDGRRTSVSYERVGLSELLARIEEWLEEGFEMGNHVEPVGLRFVRAMHIAIRNRFGEVSDQAQKANENVVAVLDRERERIRVAFARVRNHETTRGAVVEFLSRTSPNAVLQQEDDNFFKLLFDNHRWQEVKDLALLALASYRGKGGEEPGGSHQAEGTESGNTLHAPTA